MLTTEVLTTEVLTTEVLTTEVLELRECPVFADLADAQASVADYLTTTITTDYTLKLLP